MMRSKRRSPEKLAQQLKVMAQAMDAVLSADTKALLIEIVAELAGQKMQSPCAAQNPAGKASRDSAAMPFDTRLRYTISEAVAYLKCSRATIYKLIQRGDISTLHTGKRIYIPGSEIARLSELS